MSIGLVGGSGVGKSRWARYTFIYEPFKFAIENNYPLKILYFALEDPKKNIYKNIMCHYLWERYKVDISKYVIDSKSHPLDPLYLKYLSNALTSFLVGCI